MLSRGAAVAQESVKLLVAGSNPAVTAISKKMQKK